jgi:regulator of protease activity HflC (stomatin/prohibitin superfamily)
MDNIVQMIESLTGKHLKKAKVIIVLTFASLFLLIMLFSAFYRVDEGYVGVVYRNGALVHVTNPGLNLKMPFFDTVRYLKTRNSSVEKELEVYSSDSQQYKARITINSSLLFKNIKNLIREEGPNYMEDRILPLVEKTLKEVAGSYSASRVIGSRVAFGKAVFESVVEEAVKYHVRITQIQITNIDFTDKFEGAVESAMEAQAEVARERHNLEKKKLNVQKSVVAAKAAAEVELMKAKAKAEALKIVAETEVAIMEKKGKVVTRYPKYITFVKAEAEKKAVEKWSGKPPQFSGTGSIIPMVKIDK